MSQLQSFAADFGAELPFTQADFAAISAMVHAHAGICLTEGKARLVYSRLAKMLRAAGLSSFTDYVALISRDSEERAKAIEALTTNHTRFFREGHHFEHFENHVRPGIAARLQRGERVRMWSSAASSGEEAYSLAMVLLGRDRAQAQPIAHGDILLLATDLARRVLAIGEAGVYSREMLADVPACYRDLWIERSADGGVRIADAARKLVRFRALNLLNPWPISGAMDVIFCRNVLIYFDEPTKKALLDRLADQLAVGGYLYLGHSERLIGDHAVKFKAIGQTIYRKERA